MSKASTWGSTYKQKPTKAMHSLALPKDTKPTWELAESSQLNGFWTPRRRKTTAPNGRRLFGATPVSCACQIRPPSAPPLPPPSAPPTYTIKMWGAGGSGHKFSVYDICGGAGGFVEAQAVFPSGTHLKIIVGGGGQQDPVVDHAGGGGGMSAIFNGSAALTYGPGNSATITATQQRALLVAAGGGGSGYRYSGGRGGGETGEMGSLRGSNGGAVVCSSDPGASAGSNGGGPGTQTNGGTWRGGQDNHGASHHGGPLWGGWGTGGVLVGNAGWPNGGRAYGNTGTNGGGGGGGWFGGGGGASTGGLGNDGGGGGGSSFPMANRTNAHSSGWIVSVTHVMATTSTPSVAPRNADPHYGNSAGRSGTGSCTATQQFTSCTSANGSPGRVVIIGPAGNHTIFNYTGADQSFLVP